MTEWQVRANITKAERARVEVLVSELITRYEHQGRGASCITLPKELKRDLERSGWSRLAPATCRRLSRWCHAERDPSTRREDFVEPKAQEISTLLFGRIISRDEG